MGALCSVDGCDREAKARGWCHKHWRRWRKRGDPLDTGPGAAKGEAIRFYREVVLVYDGEECLIWPYAKHKGYGVLAVPGRSSFVSRILCEDTHGAPPTPLHEAAHLCGKGDHGCVTKRHLEWKTHAGNLADRLIHGTHMRGERYSGAKLTEQQAREIISLKGVVSQRRLAVQFGVSRGAVKMIHEGRNWAWVS